MSTRIIRLCPPGYFGDAGDAVLLQEELNMLAVELYQRRKRPRLMSLNYNAYRREVMSLPLSVVMAKFPRLIGEYNLIRLLFTVEWPEDY